MDVRVCGPNLNYQDKGTFHVHADGCQDLRKYGLGTQFGGETDGNQEMLVKDATVVEVVKAVYDNGIIDENVATGASRSEVISDLALDFWFAPCVKGLPYGAVLDEDDQEDEPVRVTPVYECWLSGEGIGHESSAFEKTDAAQACLWFARHFNSLTVGQHMHIVVHDQKEYVT